MPQPEKRTRIVIADDHTILREGLRRVLGSVPGFEVVGEARNGREAVQLVQQLRPDLLILDVSMPEATGLDALRDMAAASDKPPVRTLVLTASIDRGGIVTALQLGARGVVLKSAGTDVLLDAVHAVLRGEHWVDRGSVSDLAAAVIQLSAPRRPESRRFGLTDRQLEIINEVVSGLTNREIAVKLKISEDTVKHHLTQIFNKTGVSTRLELALFATHHNLINAA
jgi:DNA-binding NarL/FixJ family response regulator